MRKNLIGWGFLLLTASLASAFPTQPLRNREREDSRQSLRGDRIRGAHVSRAVGEACTGGGWRCQGADIQRCDQAGWVTITPCGGGQACASDGTEAHCAAQGQGVQISSVPTASALESVSEATAPVVPASTASVAGAPAPIASSTLEGSTGGQIGGAPAAQDKKGDTITGTGSGHEDKLEDETDMTGDAASKTPPQDDDVAEETPPKDNVAEKPPSGKDVPDAKPQSAPLGGTTSGPHYVIYTDWENSLTKEKGKMLPSVEDLKGFNRLLLAFWMTDRKLPGRPELTGKGPVDRAEYWSSLSSADRKKLKAEYNKAGISVMVTAFGESDKTASLANAATTAKDLADFVKKNDLDGIDIDYEDIELFNADAKKSVDWLITLQKTLRQELPRPYLISHAPLAPWFTTSGTYTKSYRDVVKAVGDGIDFYNIQYYNNGEEYTDCTTLMTKSKFVGTSVMELTEAGLGLEINQIVIGKPLIKPDGGSGHMTPETLNDCMAPIKGKAGVMYWQWHAEASTTLGQAIA